MNSISSVLAKMHEIATIFSRPTAEQSLVGVLEDVSRRLLHLLDVDHSTITLLDEGRQFFEVTAECPNLPLRLIGEQIPIQDRPTQLSLVNDQKPIVADILDDHALISESESFREIVRTLDIRSLLIVPMVTDGDTIGTIGIDTIGRAKCFTQEEVKLCQTVANQTAAFVAITRLRDEEQKHRRQAEMLALTPGSTAVSRHGEKVALRLFADLKEVVQFKKASLQLVVDGKRTLVGASGFDKSRSHRWLLRPVENDPIIRDIVRTQKPKILPNTATAAHWQRTEDTRDVNTWIGMPLVLKGKVIGILTLDHDQAGFYANITEDVLMHLDRLTAQAAHDLGDTYDLEVARHQIHALGIIRRFAETIATKLDPQEVRLAIVSMISKGLECTRCCILLAESLEESESLVCKAVCNGSACGIVSGPVLPNPQAGQLPSPIHAAFQSGEPTFIDDRDRDPRFDFSHPLYQGARSIIVVPLKIADQVIGVVLAVHEQPGWFTNADQLFLETLARQAASAIERDFGLDLVHSIGNKILGATKVDTVLKDVVSGAMKLTHADSGVIYELNEDCTQVVRSFKNEGSVHPRPRLDAPESITRTVISTKRMVEIPDIDHENSHVDPELRGRYRAMFAVPLLLDESVVGVLYLNCKNVRGLTETERSLLATLAGQAALAIQRTRLYERIRDSDAMYRSLVGHIPAFVLRKDRDSRFTWANANFCELVGRSLDEIKGKNDLDFYPKEDAEKYVRDDREVLETKQQKTVDEEELQPPGGKPKILARVVKTPVLDSSGDVTGLQVIFWDITKEVERKNLAERWRSLAEQSPDGIVVHQGGKITLANSEAARLFGVSSDAELKDRSIFDFLDEPSQRLAKERLEKLDNGEDLALPMVEMCVLRKPNEKVDVEVYTRRVPETNEVQMVFHDLTRTKGLLREMHHRVRRSLNEVDGFLTRQEELTNVPEVLHAFGTIRERLQAVSLIHTILYRTQKESNVDMELYLHDLVDAIFKGHGSPDGIVAGSAASGVILDEKRATACGLIVTELVSNSLLHAFPHGPPPAVGAVVSVSLRANGDALQLVVSDSGIGMSQTSEHSGEAMGLSLVRSLVLHDLKGRMATSTETGTCFTIEFPCLTRKSSVSNGE